MDRLILFGAGAAGRYCLKYLRSKGIEPVAFADNNADKWGTSIYGIPVMSPYSVNEPDAEWVATAISRPAATEIRAQMRSIGVKTKPLYECLEVFHGLPSGSAYDSVSELCCDIASVEEFRDQYRFRSNPDYDAQRDPSDCRDIYFPEFIEHCDGEHFVDCGASYGDTVQAFMARWPEYRQITAFEPDQDNYDRLEELRGKVVTHRRAVGDFDGWINFTSNGDYSSHIARDGRDSVRISRLDAMNLDHPTYIKMDIEGAELEALWGARHLIKKHSPVLAICAYHTSDHLWQIPLLIHAIQPDYRLFFRRYAEGAWEIIWYAVPSERVK